MEKTQSSKQQNQPQQAAALSSDIQPIEDAMNYMRTYARQKPEMAALWCFGIGFVLGWKLKPW